MSFIELFDRISLNDDRSHIQDNKQQVHLIKSIHLLKLLNGDIQLYMTQVKLLRNEWFRLNFCKETVLYELLGTGLEKEYPMMIDHWQMIGYPQTIYQFEYQLFRYFEEWKQ